MIELTENLLYKLEEKMMLLLSDAEGLRQQIQRLQQENTSLKQEAAALQQEKSNSTSRLQALVALLDSVNPVERVAAPAIAPVFTTVVPISAEAAEA